MKKNRYLVTRLGMTLAPYLRGDTRFYNPTLASLGHSFASSQGHCSSSCFDRSVVIFPVGTSGCTHVDFCCGPYDDVCHRRNSPYWLEGVFIGGPPSAQGPHPAGACDSYLLLPYGSTTVCVDTVHDCTGTEHCTNTGSTMLLCYW